MIERADNRKTVNKIPGNMWTLQQFRHYLNNQEEKEEIGIEEKEENEESL